MAQIRLPSLTIEALSPGAQDFLAYSPWLSAWREDEQTVISGEGGAGDAGVRYTLKDCLEPHLTCITHPDDLVKLWGICGRMQQPAACDKIQEAGQHEQNGFTSIRLARFLPMHMGVGTQASAVRKWAKSALPLSVEFVPLQFQV